LGDWLGVVATVLWDSVTDLLGRIAGYRDRVWTNWYRRPLALEILTLAYMREQLNAHSLDSSYPAGTLVGFAPPPRKTRSTPSFSIAGISRKSLMATASTNTCRGVSATLRQGAPRSRDELCTDWQQRLCQ
jgi:hypothetical protein